MRRRDALKATVLGALGLAVGVKPEPAPAEVLPPLAPPSKVPSHKVYGSCTLLPFYFDADQSPVTVRFD